jgi:hypothetical protein
MEMVLHQATSLCDRSIPHRDRKKVWELAQAMETQSEAMDARGHSKIYAIGLSCHAFKLNGTDLSINQPLRGGERGRRLSPNGGLGETPKSGFFLIPATFALSQCHSFHLSCTMKQGGFRAKVCM